MFDAPHNTTLCLLLVLTAAAAVHDVRTGLIPNRLVLAGLVLAACLRLLVEPALHGGPVLAALGSAALGAFACAVVPLLLYAAKGLGGGDVKLLIVLGFAAGPLAGVELQLYAFMLGSLGAFAWLAYRGVLLQTLLSSAALLVPGFGRRGRAAAEPARLQVRFGPAIFAGALVSALAHWRLS
jgi:prepilin peptidase CpaA